MAEQLKELIEKIQQEGIKAGEEKAAALEAGARKEAEEILAKAREEAERIVAEARTKASRLEESGRSSLKQASRDTIIALKKEIGSTLGRLTASHVHKALATDELGRLIVSLVKGCGGEHKDKIVVSLRKEDLEKVERALLAELGADAKKGITIKSAADIRGGFTISYDSGKSLYDFTDQALAEYLISYMTPQLGEILKEAASGK